MKETTPPKDPKRKLWAGYGIVIALLLLSNIFLFPAMLESRVESVNYSTFLQKLEDKELTTVQLEDQQIYFVDKNQTAYKTNAIAQDGDLVNRLEEAGVEFGTVYQAPTIWDTLFSLVLSFLPLIVVFWFLNNYLTKRMKDMGGANAMLFGGKSGAKQYVVDDKAGIKFSDVAGEDEAKESLQEIVDFLHNHKRYEEIGAKMPKGVLLVGPRAPARPCWPGRWPAKPGCPSSASPAASLLRCLWAWAPPRCGTCSSRPEKKRPASSLLTRSTPSAKSGTAPAPSAATTSGSRR